MRRLEKEEYIEYIRTNPEYAALIEIENGKVFLKSDMEFHGSQQFLCVECMCFQLNNSKNLLRDLEECRSSYAGGITFPIENCENENAAIEIFMQQSNSDVYILVKNNELEYIIHDYCGCVYLIVDNNL